MNKTILNTVLGIPEESSETIFLEEGQIDPATGSGCGEACVGIDKESTHPPNAVHPYAYIGVCIYYIEGVGILTVGIIGIIINLMATRLLLRTKRRHTFHTLLLTLTVYDLLQIGFSIICFALPQLSAGYRNHIFIYIIPFMIPLAQITLAGSSFTTVSLTVERYISLCAPYLRYSHGIRSVHYVVPVLVFSALYNSPRFFEWRTHSEKYTRPCYQHFGVIGGMNTERNFIPTDMISMNISDIEDFTGTNEVWKHYDDEVLNNAAGKLSQPIGGLPSTSQNDQNFVFSSNDTDNLSHHQKHTMTLPDDSVMRPQDLNYQMDWTQASNCTEEVWNVTLVPSSLRKNTIYLTLYINWMNFFINLLLPLLIMFILNLGIYRVLKNLWAAHRTCCMNHRNRQNNMTTIIRRGRRASLGVERFLRRVSHNSSNIEEHHTVESILAQDINTPQRSVTSRLPSPSRIPSTDNMQMRSLRVESDGSKRPSRPSQVSVEGHENSSITVIATCSDRDHEERERDVRYTRVSILMVVLYFVCHAPRIITNTVEMAVASDKIPIWFELLVCVNHLLLVSNSSFNFLIYLWASKRKSDQANNIFACPSLISWLRKLCGRLRVQRFQRRRQDQQHKNKFASNAKGENYNGSCVNENHRLSEVMVPMINVTSSPTTPNKFENNATITDDNVLNIA